MGTRRNFCNGGKSKKDPHKEIRPLYTRRIYFWNFYRGGGGNAYSWPSALRAPTVQGKHLFSYDTLFQCLLE